MGRRPRAPRLDAMDGSAFSGSERLSAGSGPASPRTDSDAFEQGAEELARRLSALRDREVDEGAAQAGSDPFAQGSGELVRRLDALVDEATRRVAKAERDVAGAEGRKRDRATEAASRKAEGEEHLDKLERALESARIRPPFTKAEAFGAGSDPLEELKSCYASANGSLIEARSRFFKGALTRQIAENRNSIRTLIGHIEEDGASAVEEAEEQIREARRAQERIYEERDARISELRDALLQFDASLPPTVSDWSSPAWDRWTCGTRPTRALRLGTLVPDRAVVSCRPPRAAHRRISGGQVVAGSPRRRARESIGRPAVRPTSHHGVDAARFVRVLVRRSGRPW